METPKCDDNVYVVAIGINHFVPKASLVQANLISRKYSMPSAIESAPARSANLSLSQVTGKLNTGTSSSKLIWNFSPDLV